MTGNLYTFDPSAYYAQHEMEIGMWRVDYHKMKAQAFKRHYLRNMDITEQIDDLDDRNRLYSVKTKLMHSVHVPGSNQWRRAIEDRSFLLEKRCSGGFDTRENASEGGEND